MKKLLVATTLLAMVPQLAMAAWWNPLTWDLSNFATTSTKLIPDPSISIPSHTVSTPASVKSQAPASTKLNGNIVLRVNGSTGPARIVSGQPVTVRWTTDKELTSCGLNRVGDDVVIPVKSRGAYIFNDITATTKLRITCISKEKKIFSDTIEIQVAK